MAEKRFFARFGSGNPQLYSGLTPTFLFFMNAVSGVSLTAPSIAEVGVSTGFYTWTYDVGVSTILGFNLDAGPSITDGTRYTANILDPIAAVDRHVGFPTDTYGTTVGASTVFGYALRNNEQWQSDATFSKVTGVWSIYAQGTTTLLFTKTLANSSAQVTKV